MDHDAHVCLCDVCATRYAINVTVEMILKPTFGCTYCYGNCMKLAQHVCMLDYVGVIVSRVELFSILHQNNQLFE